MAFFKKTQLPYWIAGASVLVASLCGIAALHAAGAGPATPVPVSITQQGRILNADGTAVSSKVAIVFTIYDDPTASADANVLWSETQNLTLDDGYFSTQLGAAAANAFPAGIFDGSVRYLGVKVGSDAEMTPRQTVTSVPYALQAASASAATGALNVRIAALESQLSCPDATAPGKYGFCIWEIGNAAYTYTFQTAATACAAQGARLCTVAELSAAQAAGAQWCDFGWVADRVDNGNGYRAYPMQQTLAGCGSAGVNLFQSPFATGADATCCKP
ncbi:MAG TPA: hypothetical protein VGM44_23135 [Polyangiaceae bacterium]|jgi:hypothetical protein